MKNTSPNSTYLPPPAPSAPVGGPPGVLTFTGFDDDKLAAPLALHADGRPKSAKYTFAKLAKQSGVMPRSKGEAEQWFNEHIKAGLQAAGFQIDQVKRHQVFIHTRENPQGEWIDFMRFQSLAWETQDTGTAAVVETPSANAVEWNAFLVRLIATLQQLRDPGLSDEQRLHGLKTLHQQLGAKLGADRQLT